MAKKRNPQDSTLRNVRAAQKELKKHRMWIRNLIVVSKNLNDRLMKLEKPKPRKRREDPLP